MVITETNTVKTQKPTTDSENELVVTTKLVEPEGYVWIDGM